MIGISEIANKICNNYPILAREYLGIDISTNNIMEINDFVKAYNSNKFVSAIDKPFLFRNEEMLEIENAFKEHDIVILNGFAGCGKTHLALHYISEYTKNNNIKAYCIRGMNLPIYQDLKIYINIVLNKVPTYSPEIPYEFREKICTSTLILAQF